MKERSEEEKIPFRLEDYKNEEDVFPIAYSLSEEEKKNFPNLLDYRELSFEGKLTPAGSLYTLSLSLLGKVILKDSHDFEDKPFEVDDTVDLTIAPDDPENSDLVAEPDGSYDLKGCLLALLFDAIPKNFSTVPLKKIETPLYTLMSEEEYNASKGKNSAFDGLDESAFEDQEDGSEEEKNSDRK